MNTEFQCLQEIAIQLQIMNKHLENNNKYLEGIRNAIETE